MEAFSVWLDIRITKPNNFFETGKLLSVTGVWFKHRFYQNIYVSESLSL